MSDLSDVCNSYHHLSSFNVQRSILVSPSSIVPPTGTPSSTRSILCMSAFTSQPIDLDNGPSASSVHSTPQEASYHSEHASEDISDPNDSEPEDDISPILPSGTAGSIKIYARFRHQSDICFSLENPNSSKPY